MSDLLATKFYRPISPPNCVSRNRLIERLSDGIKHGRQITLISAPAGFGKTTCASEWLDSLNLPATWLSLDFSDDDPARFFAYLIAALQKVDESIGRAIEGILRSGQLPDADALSACIINDIQREQQSSGTFLLVLDDFHVIHDKYILQVLEKLLINMPRSLHLVLLTREDPPLPLARMRANNRLTEIRVTDLRFSDEEINAFFKETMGIALNRSDVVSLEERTEGWVAGLQLAGLSMRDRLNASDFIASLSGSNRFVLSYLTEEVLDRQPEEIRKFLLQTSILDKLTGELCDEVTGRTDSSTILEHLLAANLFLIPLDDKQRWYRYHHLFADSLRGLQKVLLRDDVMNLHRKASKWFLGSGMVNEAIHHSLAAEDFAMATSIIEDHAMEMISQGYAKTLESFMDAIPPEWGSKKLKSDMAIAWMHLLRGTYALAEPYVERVREVINNQSDKKAGEKADPALKAEWLSLQANLLNAQGKITESLDLARQALEVAPPDNSYVLCLANVSIGSVNMAIGNYDRAMEAYWLAVKYSKPAASIVSEMLSISRISLMALQQGRLQYAYDTAIQGIEHAEKLGVLPPITATVYGACGQACYYWAELEQAHKYLQRSVELSALSGHNAALSFCKANLSRLFQVEGDIERAALEIREAHEVFQLGAPAWILPELVSQQARLYVAQNRLGEIEPVLKRYGFSFEGKFSYDNTKIDVGMNHFTGLLYNSALRVLLHKAQNEQGSEVLGVEVLEVKDEQNPGTYEARNKQNRENLQAGIEMADRLINATANGRVLIIAIEALLLRAKMHYLLESREAYQSDVARAIKLAEPEGFVAIFIEEGQLILEAMRRLLKENKLNPAQSEFAGRVMAAVSSADGSKGLPGEDTIKPSIDTGYRDNENHNANAGVGAKAIKNQQSGLVEPLTDRELEVLRLMSEGLKYGEIAEELFISLNTVRSHVKSAYSKLNVNNRTQALDIAHRLKLI